jgi:hypothetical protein
MTQPFDNRDWDLRQIAEKDAEIERLKALLVRAADTLEEEFGPGNIDLMTKDPWALIAELRKAAQ